MGKSWRRANIVGAVGCVWLILTAQVHAQEAKDPKYPKVNVAATYQVDPESGAYTQLDHRPALWSPDQRTRIDLLVKSSTTTMTLLDEAGTAQATVKVTGLVSHVRWASTDNEIVFTLGRTVGGGVHQDLYVWDLVDGKAPSALTSNGASFGAEWLGVLQAWQS